MDKNVETKNGNFLRKLNPSEYNIRQQVNLVFILISLISIVTIGVISIYNSRKTVRELSEDRLTAIREGKKASVENYFSQVKNQARTYSENTMVVGAMQEFKDAFHNIARDTNTSYTQDKIIEIETSLKNYYSSNFLSLLNSKLDIVRTVENIWPGDIVASILQHYYISTNPNQAGSKQLLTKAEDGSQYSEIHSVYHPIMRNFLEKFGYEDIMLVDPESGHIVYSVMKKIDFGTNLFTGPYSGTNLAKAFEIAKNTTIKDYVKLMDFEAYDPSFGEPASFIASPIYDGEEKIGILVFQIGINNVNNLISSNGNWREEGLGETGEVYLVGNDMLMRSNARLMEENKESYLKVMQKNGISDRTINQINKFGTSVLLQEINNDAVREALKGISGNEIVNGYKGEKVLCSYSPINVDGMNWAIVAEISASETFKQLNKLRWILIIAIVLIFFAVNIIGNKYSKGLSVRINKIRNAISTLAKGEAFTLLETKFRDEIGQTILAVNQLVQRINSASDFATSIGKGEFNFEFKALSDNDRLGVSLTQMKESLQEAKEEEKKRIVEDEKRNWATQGIAKFSEILRSDNDNIEKLSYSIISNLVDYLGANQAGMFIMNDDNPDEKYLELVAAYAYNRQKFITKKIETGEGLVGTVAMEKNTVYLTEIPEDYISITSGLGKANPRSLLIVPLKVEEEVLGILEIASFNEFQSFEIEFVERVAESIASTITTVKINERTAALLVESREKANEIAQQEEEMRQNLEEMQATQEELERVKREEIERSKEMMEQQEMYMKTLINILEEIPGRVYLKDEDGRIVIANSAAAKLYNKSVEEVIGTSDFDLYDLKQARIFRDEELEVMKMGAKTYIQEEEDDNEEKRVMKVTKMPFYIPYLKQTGLLSIQLNITDIKQMEMEVQLQNEQLRKVHEELKAQTVLMDSLMAAIPDHIYFKDNDSRFLRVSQAMANAYGVNNVGDMLGKSDFDYLDDEKAQAIYNHEQDIIKTGKSIIDHLEKEISDDGTISWVSTTKMPLKNEDGVVMGTFGITRDITYIKQMEIEATEKAALLASQEEELRQNLEEMQAVQEELQKQKDELSKEKALMDALLTNANEYFYWKDRESKFIKASNSMAKSFKVSNVQQLYGKSDFDFFTDEHARPAFEDEQEIIRTGVPIIDKIEKETFEDGSSKYVTTSKMPLKDEAGNIIGTFGVSKDITDIRMLEEKAKKQAEDLKKVNEEQLKLQEKLMVEKKMFETLMNHLPDRITYKDTKGAYTRVNKAKADRLNLTNANEVIGKSDIDIFGKEHAQKAMEEELKVIASGKPILNIEEKLTFKDGSIGWVSTSRIPFKSDEGKVIGSLIFSRDITDRKNMGFELAHKEKITDGFAQKLPVFIYDVDNKGLINSIKGQGLRILKKVEKDFIGKPIDSIFPKLDKKLIGTITEDKEVKIVDGGKFAAKDTQFEHVVFRNNMKEGALVGFAYDLKAVV
ncbi:MAG: PAS domain-containing protein [Bacteroidales bacterium]|nr:PAS domain-containing protein [Bacteroidales bacterium]